ncbi:MAG: peroxiredoxin family protein [Planctomycetota bacterium]
MRNLNLLTLTCGCLCSVAASGAAAYSPRVGELHPDFTLPNIVDGAPVSLSQFRGQKVLLVHFASW